MSNFDYLIKLFYLAELLEQGNAGTACSLAEKLDVSERTVFRYLDELRMYGAVIDYSKSQKSYILKNNFNFKEVFWQTAIKCQTNRFTFNTKTDKYIWTNNLIVSGEYELAIKMKGKNYTYKIQIAFKLQFWQLPFRGAKIKNNCKGTMGSYPT